MGEVLSSQLEVSPFSEVGAVLTLSLADVGNANRWMGNTSGLSHDSGNSSTYDLWPLVFANRCLPVLPSAEKKTSRGVGCWVDKVLSRQRDGLGPHQSLPLYLVSLSRVLLHTQLKLPREERKQGVQLLSEHLKVSSSKNLRKRNALMLKSLKKPLGSWQLITDKRRRNSHHEIIKPDSTSHFRSALTCGSEENPENHFDKTYVEWSQWRMIESLHRAIIIKHHTSGTKFGLIANVI